MGRELLIEQLDRCHQAGGIPAKCPILRMPPELLSEERRRCGYRHSRQTGQLVVTDRFLIQTASLLIGVVLRQDRDALLSALTFDR